MPHPKAESTEDTEKRWLIRIGNRLEKASLQARL